MEQLVGHKSNGLKWIDTMMFLTNGNVGITEEQRQNLNLWKV